MRQLPTCMYKKTPKNLCLFENYTYEALYSNQEHSSKLPAVARSAMNMGKELEFREFPL